MTKQFYVFFGALIFLLQLTGLSQISSSTSSGCAPLVGVTFTATAGATNPFWDFGDGTTASIANPTHTFSTPNTYTVTFTATGVSAQHLIIVVHGKPSPHFSAVSTVLKGCAPLVVSFLDNSTGGGGTPINNWQWAFGDGGSNTNNTAAQTYTYNVGGQFNVSVIVTDANGCDSSFTINNLVSVSQKPTVTVTPPSPSACLPPLTVTFSVNATSHVPPPQANTLTYLWNFTGGATSTLTNPPPQTFTSTGVFTETVTVTDINNCSNTVIRNVVIQNPTAVFIHVDTVCLHAVYNSTGSVGGVTSWNYGDGTTGSNGLHTYTTPGMYHVKLTVANGSCTDTVSQTVFVEKAIANFKITPTYVCSLPKVLNITNTSSPNTGNTTSQWHYFQTYTQYSVTPSVSTVNNPSFSLSHIDTNRYTINKLDVLDSIRLIFTTSHGCKDTLHVMYMDTIFLPTARFMPNKYEGCVPLTVSFSDSSKVDNPKNPIISWKYIFGDGSTTTLTSAPGNTVHTYTSTGIYYPKLVIQTLKGCGDTSYTIKIEVGKPPSPTFSVSPTTVCIGGTVTLTNTTPASDSVDTWHYYGDGNYYISSCTDQANVTWPFSHATGTQNINMVACFRGCCSTAPNTPITVKGPLVTFSTTMNCATPTVYNFAGSISDAINWTWDFGDGTTVSNSTASTISHTYTATGDFNVVLTASNTTTGCGPSTYTVPVHVRNIKAKFTYDTLVCFGTSHVFDASTSVDVNAYGSNGYIWFWGDGTHIDITGVSTITHNYAVTGTHTVTLIVKDVNGCEDTLRKKIKAYNVMPAFIPSKSPVCINSVVTFSNTTMADTTITSYSWNFGDGIGTSTQANPTYIYNITSTSATSVMVSLTVTTSLGCTATYTLAIPISRPNATFAITSSKNICLGSGVTFTSSNSYPNMTWGYGDGITLGPTPPTTVTSHTYTSSGLYVATLTVTDAAGCTDVKSSSQNVSVQDYPVASISSPDFGSAHLCYPHQSTYTDNTVLPMGVFLSRTWNLYTGSASITGSVVTQNYSAPGTYSVTLTETTTNGCTASLTKTITLFGPIANFTLTPSIICKGQSITFGIKDTTDVDSWHWDFGDGKDTNSVSPIAHTYSYHPPNANGTTNVTLVYYSAGLSCPQTKTYTISIRQVIADFNRNNETLKVDTAHCLGVMDLFTNTSVGYSTYGWSFGNGATSTALSPQYQYTVAGTYSVQLNIKDNASGCVDTIIKKMIIYPQFTVTATGDTICSGHIAQLNASTAASYSWTAPLTTAQPNPTNIANPTVTPTITTTYSVLATNLNGCTNSTTAFVYVLQPPHDTIWSTTIIIGQTVTLPGSQASSGFTYTWSPVANLSCINCATPVFSGTVDANYVETIEDVRGCFIRQSTFDIKVEPLSSIDVPTAFTPNGDGTNEIIYVGGWGLKSLNYFKIYNRWGELVFESNNFLVGWDGTYKGTPQNIETYVYQVSANTYISTEPITKKGYLKLLR